MKVLGALMTALFVVWGIYLASPYMALADVAGAIAARDVPRIAARINIYGVRTSFVKQLLAGGLAGTELARFDPAQIGLSLGTVAFALAPAVAEVVSPAVASDFVVAGAAPDDGTDDRDRKGGTAPGLLSIVTASRWRGFRTVYVSLPTGAPPSRQVKLQLRFSRLSWRLVSVDLPSAMRERLIAKIAAARSLARSAP